MESAEFDSPLGFKFYKLNRKEIEMKPPKRKIKRTITYMNVYKFAESYNSVWIKSKEIIINQINSEGFFDVVAGKADVIRLTY